MSTNPLDGLAWVGPKVDVNSSFIQSVQFALDRNSNLSNLSAVPDVQALVRITIHGDHYDYEAPTLDEWLAFADVVAENADDGLVSVGNHYTHSVKGRWGRAENAEDSFKPVPAAEPEPTSEDVLRAASLTVAPLTVAEPRNEVTLTLRGPSTPARVREASDLLQRASDGWTLAEIVVERS